MKRALSRCLVIAVCLLLVGAASAQNRFDYCLLCHGANANGNLGIHAPKLSGMEGWYLARQLENFAAGIRGTDPKDGPGHEMMPVGLRVKQEAVLADAVAFIVSLESQKPLPTLMGNVTSGRKLYETCAACHGVRGEGNAALQAPALAARSDWYLAKQLQNFRDGIRGADARDTLGAQMRAFVRTLSDDQAITDVVAYINTL